MAQSNTNSPTVEARPPEVEALLGKVDQLLSAGQPQKALELLSRSRLVSPWVRNAVGVCQLRLGNVQAAVEMYRGMVVAGLDLRADVPLVLKTNYATALLLAKNVAGSLAVLSELPAAHPAVQKLRVAIERWKSGLSLWQKIQWYTGTELDSLVSLDFPPGDLE